MSKKKNTLQDLDAFLKQQAATLVTPNALITTGEEKPVPIKMTPPPTEVEVSDPLSDFGSKEDPAFRRKLYDYIIDALEGRKDSLPEDKMLINTALYLKGGNDWKDVIRQYWREH
jgi:hypothetical protein